MKNLSFLLILLFVYPASALTQELTGDQIIKKVNDSMNPFSAHSVSRLTINTSSGKKRTFVYESWTKQHGSMNLIRYKEPARTRGQAILMLNNADDIWIYFPRTRRVRKLATHAKRQKMEGSDFSYEDMGSGDSFINDFSTKKLRDEKRSGKECYKIELTRKPNADVSYSRLIMWVDKENFVPIVIDYYDDKDSNRLVKELILSDIKTIDTIPTAMKMVMINKKDNSRTIFEIISVEYNVEISDKLFSERGIKQ